MSVSMLLPSSMAADLDCTMTLKRLPPTRQSKVG
jgi:hypothetical protein